MGPPDRRDPKGAAAAPGGVFALLLSPSAEFERLAAAPESLGRLAADALPLAAIGPVCRAVGRGIFGVADVGGPFRPSTLALLGEAGASYILIVSCLAAFGLIAAQLSRPFGGAGGLLSGLRLAVCCSTPGWLAGVVYIIPPLGILAGLGSLYGLYVFVRGAAILIRPRRGGLLAYSALTIVCYVALSALAGSLFKLLIALI